MSGILFPFSPSEDTSPISPPDPPIGPGVQTPRSAERSSRPRSPRQDLNAGQRRALQKIQDLLDPLGSTAEVLGCHGDVVNLHIPFAGESYAADLTITRCHARTFHQLVTPPSPSLDPEKTFPAEPIPLHAFLTGNGMRERCEVHGLAGFIAWAQGSPARWKRQMLGCIPARTWLKRSGHISRLNFKVVPQGWPYLRVDGHPPRLPQVACWRKGDPPLNPWELCQSFSRDGEWWLFTCECSVPYCGGIHRGVFVAHDDGLVVWRCPEQPEIPFAVFEQRQYRNAVVTVLKRLLETATACRGLSWITAVRPQILETALEQVRSESRR